MMPAKMRTISAPGASSLLLNWQPIILVFLTLAALFIRLSNVNEPPLNYHATRQYRSLLIARALYYESQASVPEWKKQVAQINKERQGVLEPPVMETLVALSYRLVGGENFWIPRLLSSLFWITGGYFLYLIAKRIAGGNAALFSMAFYLFLPFAVLASRSFQPDPLMVLLFLASIFAIFRYHEQPSSFWLVASYVLSASAIFIKPVSLFGIYSVFVMLAIGKYGVKKTISDFRSILFVPVTLLPALIFYLYGLFVARSLQAQAEASFLPQLLFTPFFWRGWLNNIHEVVGFTAFIASLIGVLLVRKGVARLLLLGLWVGYALFCLVFSYHIATHDYYHLQLVPIVAISLSPVAALIVERLLESDPDPYWRWALASILSLALLLSLAVARAGLVNPGYENKVRMAEEIGELVQHSTNTAYLAADYGLSLEYHGELSGQPWPLVSDLEWEHLAGVPVLEAGARFHRLFGKQLPKYFIVEEMNEFDQQQDLKQFLLHDYAVLAEQDSFVVYELR